MNKIEVKNNALPILNTQCIYFEFIWYVFFVEGFTKQAFVTLSGNQHVKRFGDIRLNCSSNITPIGNTASIKIDGKAYTSITSLRDGCFSSILGTQCNRDICECSTQGLWYSYTYKTVQNVGVMNFKCLMTFNADGPVSDSISVNIIGR